ncbi:protein RALF-like 33 [Cocos nucifera]|nr:protein RALF-like 33 [Cocos nucifera]
MERKRWKALAFLFVAFLFSNAVISAHSAVAAAAVYRGSSCNRTDINCEGEEEMEFDFGSKIEMGFPEAQMPTFDYKPLIPEEFLLDSKTSRRFLGPGPRITARVLKPDGLSCNPGQNRPYGKCLPNPKPSLRGCSSVYHCRHGHG